MTRIITMSRDKDFIKVNKKTLWAIAPAMPIIGVLLSKNRPAELVLFLLGIVIGAFIGKYSAER